jgi:hypothetical protein
MTPELQDQHIRHRMAMLREEVRSGATEMTGKTYRDSSGKIAGRFGGGMSVLYPELRYSGLTPKQASDAVGRGKGKRWKRLYRAAKREVVREFGKARRRYRGRLSEAPHPGYAYCSHCREYHSRNEHRFHGAGSFYRTHPLSFGGFENPPMSKLVTLPDGRIRARKPRTVRRARSSKDGSTQGRLFNPRIKPGWTYSNIAGAYYQFPKWALIDPGDKAQVSGDTFIARADYVADGGKRASFTAPWGPIGWMDLADGRKVKLKRNPVRRTRGARRVKGARFGRHAFRRAPSRRNPPGIKIYERLSKVYAQKGPGHKCDPACKRAGHWYYHVFTSRPKMYGLANGDVLISSR